MDAMGKIIGIFTAILGVAIVAVILSKNSATSDVIKSLTGGLSSLLGVALSPVTGQSSTASNVVGQAFDAFTGQGSTGNMNYIY